MTRVLLIGGAGFIGSHVIESLLDNFYDVTIYDNFSSARTCVEDMNLRDLVVIEGDILDLEKLTAAVRCCDVVIHLAAQLEITKGYDDPMYDLDINLKGTINVIEACAKAGVKRLVNASSACVYGHTDGMPSRETDPTNPNWEYGVSKLAAEKYIQIAHEAYGINYTNLRFSIVYGVNEWYGRVLPIFIKRAIENKPLVIFGDGKQQRDYVNVKDVARFVVDSIADKKTFNQVYNISSGFGITMTDLAKFINEIFNVGIIYEYIDEGKVSDLVEGRVRIERELKYLVLDNSKAIRDTFWKPKINFEEGVREMIHWAKQNHETKWTTYKV